MAARIFDFNVGLGVTQISEFFYTPLKVYCFKELGRIKKGPSLANVCPQAPSGSGFHQRHGKV